MQPNPVKRSHMPKIWWDIHSLKYADDVRYILSNHFQGIDRELVETNQKNSKWVSSGSYKFTKYLSQHKTPTTKEYSLSLTQQSTWKNKSARTWRKRRTRKYHPGQHKMYRQGYRNPHHWNSPMNIFLSKLNINYHCTGKCPKLDVTTSKVPGVLFETFTPVPINPRTHQA